MIAVGERLTFAMGEADAYRRYRYATLFPVGISNTLLLVAVLVGTAPAAALRLHPPRTLWQVAHSLVAAATTLALAAWVTNRVYPLRLFEIMHLVYLVVVVSIPLLLGSWFVASLVRNRRSRAMTVCGGLAAMIALGGIWGTHIEPNLLRTDRVAVSSPHIDQPIKIGVLADLQTPNVGDTEWNAIEALISEKPDLVVVPGDLFQGNWNTIFANSGDFSDLLAALVAEIELVAVVSGDHDISGQLEPIVQQAGATYLDNDIMDVVVAGQQIRLAGVAVHPSPAKAATIEELRSASDTFTVLISHRPGITYALSSDVDVDLVVAGHTHGSQINLPFISDRLWYSDVPAIAANGGLSRINDFLLYVSTGVGMERNASPQVRFGRRPAVGVINVVPG